MTLGLRNGSDRLGRVLRETALKNNSSKFVLNKLQFLKRQIKHKMTTFLNQFYPLVKSRNSIETLEKVIIASKKNIQFTHLGAGRI